MILYDPDPLQLFNDKELPEYITIKLPSGGFLLAEPSTNYEMKIVSINSTDPMDFMNSQYQPGSVIKLKCDTGTVQM